MSESTFGAEPGEPRSGTETGFDEEETSYSSDVRSGYDDDDQPPARVVEETSEDETNSAAADRAAGYEDEDDEDLEDETLR